MINTANIIGTLTWDILWQSSVILALGLLIARRITQQPAKAHAVLALSLVAAVTAPLASQAVRHGGWGLLPPEPKKVAAADRPVQAYSVAMTREPQPSDLHTVRTPDDEQSQGISTNRFLDQGEPPLDAVASPRTAEPAVPAPALIKSAILKPADAPYRFAGLAPAVLAIAWMGVTLLLAVRLMRGAIAGHRLLASAGPCESAEVTFALESARRQLNLGNVEFRTLRSARVRCPMIWCWGRAPRLILPDDAATTWSRETWTPVLCHELAHWKRRDHWSALLAELVCIALPWQVLAWWAKRGLEHTSEQACDDWTVAAGHSPVDYAEVLLGLAAQADPPLALAAVRRRSGLAARVQHIITQAVPRPSLGRLWAVAVLGLTLLGIGGAAVCQRGVARADSAPPATAEASADATADSKAAPPKKAAKPAKPAAKPADMPSRSPRGASATGVFIPGGSALTEAMAAANKIPAGDEQATDADDTDYHKTVAGRVVDPDGKPLAGADVYLEAAYVATRVGESWPGPKRLTSGTTGASGQFSLESSFLKKDLNSLVLAIRARGFGVRSKTFSVNDVDDPIEIALEPSQPIEGTVYSPNGQPVPNAKVRVQQIYRTVERDASEEERKQAWYLNLTPDEIKSTNPRPYWPEIVTTDDQGQFRYDDLIPRSAAAVMTVLTDEYAPTRVAVAGPNSRKPDYETYRDPKFMLVLEPPYVVEGRFLDEKTDEPIPGVRLTVMPMSNRRGGNRVDSLEVTTNDEGRYTLRLGAADTYWTQIYPPAGYPGINRSISSREIDQLGGMRKIVNYEVKLRPGLLVRGRVVAQDTGEPVAGAGVVYQPPRKRKLGINSEFRPVETDADGNFEVTAVDGVGFLLVDAPGTGFYRVKLDDERTNSSRGPLSPHGYLEVDIPSEGSAEPYEIALKRGTELVAHVVGPDGKRVKKLLAGYEESEMDPMFQSRECNDGVFRMDAAEPGRTYRVFLFSEDAKAGKVAELAAPTDGKPLEVKLEPCATVRGRYVYETGSPAPEVTNFSHFALRPDQQPDEDRIFNLPFYDNLTRYRPPSHISDADGNFVLDGIVPDVNYYLSVNFKFENGKGYYPIGTLKPGEVRDVGELVISPN